MTALATSPSLLRLQQIARANFARFGGLRSFQKYVATKDLDAGSESWAASGSPVQAACQWDQVTTYKEGQGGTATVILRERVLLVEIPAFEAFGGLTADWRWTDFEGVERRLQNAVRSEDGTYYIVRTGS